MSAQSSAVAVSYTHLDVEALLTQGLWDSWSFGPALVVDGALPERYDTDVSGKNPRTAIGQRADGSYVAVAVDGRLPGYSEGMTIEELAQYLSLIHIFPAAPSACAGAGVSSAKTAVGSSRRHSRRQRIAFFMVRFVLSQCSQVLYHYIPSGRSCK